MVEDFKQIEDPRKRRTYSVEEFLLAGLMLFLFKQKSRNEMDNNRRDVRFAENYYRCFKLRLPSLDAVEDFFRKIDGKALEELKARSVALLIEKKCLQRFRLLGKWYLTAIDGTGVYSSDKSLWNENTHKTSSKGKVTYMNNVLEAKLVTSKGITISLCSEWIVNPSGGEYDKQDCESKAFKRLAVKLKEYFPRLKLCLLFDGLYCNAPVMEICKEYGWQWIIVFKDGNLPSVHEELNLRPSCSFKGYGRSVEHQNRKLSVKWNNTIEYGKHILHWIACDETVTGGKNGDECHHFEYLTNIEQQEGTIEACLQAGRLRRGIEDSFNDQKNRDFEMQRLFSRHSFRSFGNWYRILGLAHNIYEFITNSAEIKEMLAFSSKQTLRHIWQNLLSFMSFVEPHEIDDINEYLSKARQTRMGP